MASSMPAAYSSGETAFDVLSMPTSNSARPLGSRNSTWLVPNSDTGGDTSCQSAGALTEKRPWGSCQATSVTADAPASGDGAVDALSGAEPGVDAAGPEPSVAFAAVPSVALTTGTVDPAGPGVSVLA